MRRLLILLVLLAFSLAFVAQIRAVPNPKKYNCHISQDGKCVFGIGSKYCNCEDSEY